MELDFDRLKALLDRWRARGGPDLDPDYRQLSLAGIEGSLDRESRSTLLDGPPSTIRVERGMFEDAECDPFHLYESFRFWSGEEPLLARSYPYAVQEVRFLCRSSGGEIAMLEADDFRSELFREAVSYLRELGKTRFEFEGPSGVEPIPIDFLR